MERRENKKDNSISCWGDSKNEEEHEEEKQGERITVLYTMYGTLMEDTARQEYISHQQRSGHPGLITEDSGLVISMDNPWMAASPDGRVQDPTATNPEGLVEFKNPFTMKDLTIGEACTKKTFCLEQKKADRVTYSLKQTHNYYYQVQCQMYCCDVAWCDFVVRTEKDLNIERINRDKKWFQEKLPKLKQFYFDALLPSPRQGKGGIREPQPTP